MSDHTMDAAVVAAATLTTEMNESMAAGRDPAGLLDAAGERVGFLGEVAPDWNGPGAPPETSAVPAVAREAREALLALQTCLMELRVRAEAEAEDEGVLEGEGFGNSEWALMRLTLLTGVPWRPVEASPEGVVRAATAAISAKNLSEEDFLRDFSDGDATFGHDRLFNAMHAVRDNHPEPLTLLDPLLKAMRAHAKEVKAGKLPESWLIHVFLDNLQHDVMELRD